MSKKKIPEYSIEQVERYIETAIRNEHFYLQMVEQRFGQRSYDTFGEWKKENPNHPLAKMNYPDYEYLNVISAFKVYFDRVCANSDELDI